MFHASVTVRQCDPDPGWQHPPSVMSQIKMFFLLGEQRGSVVLKKKKKKTLTALPNPIFFLLLPLTHLLPVATCQHTLTHTHTQNHPVDHVEEGRGVQEESTSFPDLQRNSSQALLWQGERKKKRKKEEEMNRRQDGDTRQGEILTTGFIVEVQGFHYQSVGPLRKTRHTGSVSGEEEFLHHKQNDSVANLLKDFMISSVNYVTVVPLWGFFTDHAN